MSTILQDLETQIAGLKTTTTKRNVCVVREVGDGVARIEGLSDVMLNEAIEFPNGVLGLALNLEETEVGAILLGDYEGVVQGSEVRTTGRLLSVPVGKGLLGRVVNAVGQPIDGKGPIKTDAQYPVEKIAPGVMKRQAVSQPLQTGIMAVDAMIPIGRGQRELIIGDRATGKTAVALDAIISQAKINIASEKAGTKDFRTRTWPGPLPFWNNPGRCLTRPSFPRPLPRRLPTSISHHLPERPWASGTWTMGWML